MAILDKIKAGNNKIRKDMKKIYSVSVIFLACMLGFTSCVEEAYELGSASLMYSIEIDMAVKDKAKLYVDKTDSPTLPMSVGEEIQLGYITDPADQSELTHPGVKWTTSNESVVRVSPDGLLTAVTEGVAVVSVAPSTVNVVANASLKITVVKDIKKVTTIELTALTNHISEMSNLPSCYQGDTLNLIAKVIPEDATYRTVLWSSKDTTIAVVNPITGAVAGVKPGEAEIVASALDGSGVIASQKVYVDEVILPEGLKITNAPGESDIFSVSDMYFQIEFETSPKVATKSCIVWESSNPAVAEVDTYGKVKILTYGDVTIKATCPDSETTHVDGFARKAEIKMNIPAGFYKEHFENPDVMPWSMASEGGVQELRFNEQGENYMYFTPNRVDNNTLRGDIRHQNPTYISREFPILCFRMDDVNDQGYSRSIKFDTSGNAEDGTKFAGEFGGGNCKWKIKHKCSDGSAILVYDLASQNFPTGGSFPEGTVGTFSTFQFKYADIRNSDKSDFADDPDVHYRLFWFHTFRNENEMNEYLAAWSENTKIAWGDYVPGEDEVPGEEDVPGEEETPGDVETPNEDELPGDEELPKEEENPGEEEIPDQEQNPDDDPSGEEGSGDEEVPVPPVVPPGYYHEVFGLEETVAWKVATNGAVQEWNSAGYIKVTPFVNENNVGRGDIKHEGSVILNRDYSLVCFRIDDVKDRGYSRNIKFDVVGKLSDGTSLGGMVGGGDNRWTAKFICSDGSAILVYDLTKLGFGGNSEDKLLPEGTDMTCQTFQLKYADIKSSESFTAEDIMYRMFWFCTFSNEDEMIAYMNEWSADSGITYLKK